MSISRKNLALVFALVAALTLVATFLLPSLASANPSIFAPTKETAPATTTLAYLSPGAGTTTLAYDSLSGDSVKINTLNVAFQYTASATAPVLNVRMEDSQNGIDWYPRSIAAGTNATTSLMTTPYNIMSFTLSTTTDNGGTGTFARVHQSFTVNAPMRYVRAVFYAPIGTTNGGLWAQFIPVKEDTE